MNPDFQRQVLETVALILSDEVIVEQPVGAVQIVDGTLDEVGHTDPYLLVSLDTQVLRLTVSFEAIIPT